MDRTCSDVWAAFCSELGGAGALVDQFALLENEADRAEGLRYLTRMLRVGFDLAVEFADPLRPELILAQDKTFGDGGTTPDCVYHQAMVDGRHRYRLHGARGGAPLLEVGLYSGKLGLQPDSTLIASWLEDQISVDDEGQIDIRFGGEPDHEDVRYVFIRQYTHDWQTTERASLQLEAVDGPAGPTPPPGFDAVVDGLRAVPPFVATQVQLWAGVVAGVRKAAPNRLMAVEGKEDLTLPSGHRYGFGHYVLEDDEALVVEFSPDEVPYWGFGLTNTWFEPFDYGESGSHRNNRTVETDADGSVRIVVSARRPQSPNWIDTRGHRTGAMTFRWFRTANPIPELRTSVVPIREA
jgi:hypothetical protein